MKTKPSIRCFLDVAGAVALVAGTAFALWLVPADQSAAGARPTTQAIYGTLAALAALGLARRYQRGRLERATLAIFLAAMPVVYLRVALDTHAGAGVEVIGLVVFGATAALGYLRPIVLVVGIAAHGLAWDLWHLARGPVADWYAVACAVIDVSFAAYAATRLRRWAERHDGTTAT